MSDPQVLAKLQDLLSSQKVLKLATAGGQVSPWITSVYFTAETPFGLLFTLEKRGRGTANLAANPKVAVAIDASNPFTVFAQGEGVARLLPDGERARVTGALLAKIPEAKPLYEGELLLVTVDISSWHVTSFPDGWFPAKVLTR